MYYDRKNIVPEHKIVSSLKRNSLSFSRSDTEGHLVVRIAFENLGSRPVCISEIIFYYQIRENARESEITEFKAQGTLNFIIPSVV